MIATQIRQKDSEGDSPLRYKINRLGGRSKQEKWILQAELFNEINRWVSGKRKVDASMIAAQRRYELARHARIEPTRRAKGAGE